MDIKSIEALIALVDQTNIGEVKIKDGSFKLVIRRKNYHQEGVVQTTAIVQTPAQEPNPTPATTETVATSVPVNPESAAAKSTETHSDTVNLYTVKSPMIGTFYRASSPDQEALVKVGDSIKKGQVLGIIEAMKLFNDLESEVDGKIVKVLVDNATAVEYDQPLFLIEPVK